VGVGWCSGYHATHIFIVVPWRSGQSQQTLNLSILGSNPSGTSKFTSTREIKMKAIFLDFDGVLNSFEDIARGIHIDQEKVLKIDKLCRHINDDVVVCVSSSWRVINTQTELIKILRSSGLRSNVKYSVTGQEPAPGCQSRRGVEIQYWLDAHPAVDGYVIIDDDRDFLEHQLPFHIHTSMNTGFTDEHLEAAKNIFDCLDLC
jgi:hypothetical protein